MSIKCKNLYSVNFKVHRNRLTGLIIFLAETDLD